MRSHQKNRTRGRIRKRKRSLSKKARGSGDGEVRLAANVKKVAKILLVLATMVEMRGGRKASSVEAEMMIEARRKQVEICEEFGPKDVFEETNLAACCPKMSIGEKLEVTKVKVSDSVNLPFELPISELRLGGSNALTSSHLRKHSAVQHRMNLVHAPTHKEIAKIVQNIVNAHMPGPDHKTWIVPSTSDCINKISGEDLHYGFMHKDGCFEMLPVSSNIMSAFLLRLNYRLDHEDLILDMSFE
ncbi:hypothetical protein Tco_0090799 [Tanacetum coccineum]